MTDNRVYWIWLQRGLAAGSPRVSKILSRFGSPKEFFEGGREYWLTPGLLSEREYEALDSFTLEDAAAQIEFAERLGQKVIVYDDPAFPPLLREIPAPPCALYVKGELPEPGALCIAMVGTRKATSDGIEAASRLSRSLGERGVVVVSGGALGIDSACHEGAMEGGGETVCVLGCGIGANYLMKNAPLRSRIARNGALVSEYPPNTPASVHTFPVRNRILSGLCAGTVVIECGEKSGALVTVSLALEQGRDVFAVPGSPVNPSARGVNRLISDGAKPVLTADDILEEYPSFSSNRALREARSLRAAADGGEEAAPIVRIPCGEERSPTSLSREARALYDLLTAEQRHVSELAAKAGLSMRETLGALTELELGGWIHSYSGRRYSR